ncbi:MAG: tetraacyldisaccharide 4'-kinase [Cyclobacteriaceae bacterium]
MKFILFPFALIYGWITSFRNHMYDLKLWKSVGFDLNVISIGNLAVGGTGKSTMVEYIVDSLLKNGHKPATLSRGYKRKTKGFRLTNDKDTALTVGDEPYQFWLKYGKDVPVAVGEDRVMAIPQILFENADRDSIVCDDAFQHRPIRPALNILLSTYNNPFFSDHIMPMGKLREPRKGAERADVLVFTKCPSLSKEEMQGHREQSKKYLKEGTPMFFATTKYKEVVPLFENGSKFSSDIILVSGLANSKPLDEYAAANFNLIDHLDFPDHHSYSKKDEEKIMHLFNRHSKDLSEPLSIVTTEKDATKLRNMIGLASLPVFYLPIEIEFLYEGDKFERLLSDSFMA